MPISLKKNNKGSILLFILIFGAVSALLILSGVATYEIYEHKASFKKLENDRAFHIAEAGIDYYRWHLAHNPLDFQDGTATLGPYVHPYLDKDGNVNGYYSLNITPPEVSNSSVLLESTGWTVAEPNSKRTVQVRLARPALSDYSILSNANINVGFTTEIHGAMHSNGGIRFDGITDSWVSSAKDRYQYENQTHEGVWGAGGPKSFWKYPVPAADFVGITKDISVLRDAAVEAGELIPSSGVEGWHLVFKADNTVDTYKVTALNCYHGQGKYVSHVWKGTSYCYDVQTEVFVENMAIPTNGVIFVEDTVWVEGVINGYVSVATARFPNQPSNYQKIIIPNSITYAQEAGKVALGLITQGDIIVPHTVPDTMRIDAALLSQFGSIFRPFYDGDEHTRLMVFGSQISYLGGGWKWVNGFGNVISGFINTDNTFDSNLTYFPPPGFPVSDMYHVISWEEVRR